MKLKEWQIYFVSVVFNKDRFSYLYGKYIFVYKVYLR